MWFLPPRKSRQLWIHQTGEERTPLASQAFFARLPWRIVRDLSKPPRRHLEYKSNSGLWDPEYLGQGKKENVQTLLSLCEMPFYPAQRAKVQSYIADFYGLQIMLDMRNQQLPWTSQTSYSRVELSDLMCTYSMGKDGTLSISISPVISVRAMGR